MNAGPRGKEIYVQTRTKERLFHILNIEQDGVSKVTIDAIADRMLNERIEQVYPNIKTLEKRLDALTDQLRCELLTPTTET